MFYPIFVSLLTKYFLVQQSVLKWSEFSVDKNFLVFEFVFEYFSYFVIEYFAIYVAYCNRIFEATLVVK